MNKFLKFIVVPGDGETTLGFDTPLAADAFMRNQSSNLQWLEQWTFRYQRTPMGDLQFLASTKDRVVLHFNSES